FSLRLAWKGDTLHPPGTADEQPAGFHGHDVERARHPRHGRYRQTALAMTGADQQLAFLRDEHQTSVPQEGAVVDGGGGAAIEWLPPAAGIQRAPRRSAQS